MHADAETASPKHVIILVHGIRTFGDWQNRLGALLKSKEPEAEVHVYKYRYFSTFAFLLPPLRRRVVKKFRDYLLSNTDSWRTARVDIVAHSFGTYIVARALAMLSAGGPRFHTVILSGSVLKVTFPWDAIIGRDGRVNRVINDCASKDIWPLIAQILVLGMGIAGRYGFVGATGPDVGLVNRFFPFGHSGFFTPTKDYESDDRFMEGVWLPLLTGDAPPEGPSLLPPKARWFAGFEYAAEPLKMVLVMLIVFGIYQGYRSVDDSMVGANARANLAEARSLIDVNPIEALLLTVESNRLRKSTEAQEIKQRILESLYLQAVQRLDLYRRWSSGGSLGGKGWFRADKMSDITDDRSLYLYGERGEAKLFNLRNPEAMKTLEAQCGESRGHLTTLRFSQSGARILVARHAFIFVYDIDGKLLAKSCRWVTKDQWNYLELFQDDSLLLASANEGQIMFFEVRAADGKGILHPVPIRL